MNILGWQPLLTGLKEAIAPPRCIRCLREDTWYCVDCQQQHRLLGQTCIICKESRPSGRICPDCREDTLLTGTLSASLYSTPHIRRGIGWLKFRSIRDVAPALAYLTLPYLANIASITTLQHQAVLVPIPLHRRRYNQRGFNQAEEIAQAITRYTNIPTTSLLERPRATYAQARMPKQLRKENLEGAFIGNQSVTNNVRYIILVDDVTTTGATLTSAAHALRSHVSPEIQLWGLTVARG